MREEGGGEEGKGGVGEGRESARDKRESNDAGVGRKGRERVEEDGAGEKEVK